MTRLPARTGWEWIRQGFDLFRQQPGSLAFLFLGYMTIMFAIGVVPLAGQILPVVLIPVFAAAFMQAAAAIDRGERALPTLIMTGFRKPVFGQLFKLGLVYLVVAVVAVGSTALVDGGTFWKLMTGQLDPRSETARTAALGMPLLLAVTIYIPAAMAFAFAAPLILWQQMGVAKSVFYSFFAVLRNLRAFVVFALSWFLLSILVSNIILLLAGRQFAVFVMLPVSIILTLVMHCSFYASYRQIFGAPGAETRPAAESV